MKDKLPEERAALLDSKPVGDPHRLSTFTAPAPTDDFYSAFFRPDFDRPPQVDSVLEMFTF